MRQELRKEPRFRVRQELRKEPRFRVRQELRKEPRIRVRQEIVGANMRLNGAQPRPLAASAPKTWPWSAKSGPALPLRGQVDLF